MKILIIGTARSGTTTLTTAIGSALKLNQMMEPFNPGVPYNFYSPELENIILKTLIQHHKTFDELVELSKNFDKVILLSRRDKIASWESYCSGVDRRNKVMERNGFHDGFHLWHQPYVFNPESLDEKSKDKVIRTMDNIVSLSEYMNIPIIWYEDLYSTNKELAEQTFNNLGINVKYDDVYTYMNPTKKYRKDKPTLL